MANGLRKDLTTAVGSPSDKMLAGLGDIFSAIGAGGTVGGIGASIDVNRPVCRQWLPTRSKSWDIDEGIGRSTSEDAIGRRSTRP